MSDLLTTQAIGCVHRLGQAQVVKVYEYYHQNLINLQQVQHNTRRAIPDLSARLNQKCFKPTWISSTGELDHGVWAKN